MTEVAGWPEMYRGGDAGECRVRVTDLRGKTIIRIDDHPRVYSANSITVRKRIEVVQVRPTIDSLECNIYKTILSHITIDMTHFTDTLSGIVRHCYIDPVAFLDNPVDSQLGWTSIATW
jgi:hypothetical protein